MARGKKSGGRDFPVGHSGNPNGRPRLPSDIREFRKSVGAEFELVFYRLLNLKEDDFQTVLSSPESTLKELLIAGFLDAAIKERDTQRFALICDRIMGSNPKAIAVQAELEVQATPSPLNEPDPDTLFNLMRYLGDKPGDEPFDVEAAKNAIMKQNSSG